MHQLLEQSADMATALLAGEKLRELILPGAQDDRAGALAALLLQLKLELPFDRVVTIGTVLVPILLVTLVFTKNFAEEPIYCYTPHNFTRDQALYARGYCWTELRDALPGVDASLWPSLFEHKLLPYSLLAFAAIMYVPALGWEFLASTRLTSELNFLLQEIDNCYHRAAEGRAPKIEKQIQSKGPGITERERREIIENAEKEKSPEQNLFEKYLERRGRSNFLAKLYLARHLLILLLSVAPISYLCTYYATQKQNEFTCALGAAPGGGGPAVRVSCKLPSVQLQRIVAGVDIVLLCSMNLIILVNLIHLFIFRKSNFIFDKLHKVGIKTRRQWRRSQFCDINILAHQHSVRGPGGGGRAPPGPRGRGQPHCHPAPAADPHRHLRRAEDSSEYRGVLRGRAARPPQALCMTVVRPPLTPAPRGCGLRFARHCPLPPSLLSACLGAQHLSHPAPRWHRRGAGWARGWP
uniref:Pannexin n=1 Tax=Sus scrofa TaxID=9823 RepID=A0A8D0N280_PIG